MIQIYYKRVKSYEYRLLVGTYTTLNCSTQQLRLSVPAKISGIGIMLELISIMHIIYNKIECVYNVYYWMKMNISLFINKHDFRSKKYVEKNGKYFSFFGENGVSFSEKNIIYSLAHCFNAYWRSHALRAATSSNINVLIYTERLAVYIHVILRVCLISERVAHSFQRVFRDRKRELNHNINNII